VVLVCRPKTAPVASLNVTENDLVPRNGAALLTGTSQYFAVASPFTQLSTRVTAVY
jgi:hypothetical protein